MRPAAALCPSLSGARGSGLAPGSSGLRVTSAGSGIVWGRRGNFTWMAVLKREGSAVGEGMAGKGLSQSGIPVGYRVPGQGMGKRRPDRTRPPDSPGPFTGRPWNTRILARRCLQDRQGTTRSGHPLGVIPGTTPAMTPGGGNVTKFAADVRRLTFRLVLDLGPANSCPPAAP